MNDRDGFEWDIDWTIAAVAAVGFVVALVWG